LKIDGNGHVKSGMDKEGFEKWAIIPIYEGQSRTPNLKK